MANGLIKTLGLAGMALTAWYFLDPKKGAARRENFVKGSKDLYDSASDELGRLGKDLSANVSDVVDRVGKATGDMASRVGQVTGDVVDRVGQVTGDVMGRVGQLAGLSDGEAAASTASQTNGHRAIKA